MAGATYLSTRALHAEQVYGGSIYDAQPNRLPTHLNNISTPETLDETITPF